MVASFSRHKNGNLASLNLHHHIVLVLEIPHGETCAEYARNDLAGMHQEWSLRIARHFEKSLARQPDLPQIRREYFRIFQDTVGLHNNGGSVAEQDGTRRVCIVYMPNKLNFGGSTFHFSGLFSLIIQVYVPCKRQADENNCGAGIPLSPYRDSGRRHPETG